jgi:hypothetical protein
MRSRILATALASAAAIGSSVPARVAAQAGAASGSSTWTAPRTADGQPNIEGFWANQGRRLATYDIEAGADPTHVFLSGNQTDDRSLVIDPPDGRIPYQPWARAKRTEVLEHHTNITKWEYVDPHTRCFLSGVPRVFYQGMFQFLQPPGYVVILQEFNHGSRIIPLDGRPHAGEAVKLWMGDSRGRWEGNTLVVDVTNHNDKPWFDIVGDFHSDALRVSERYTVVGPDAIDYQATFEDPKVYTRPFTIALNFRRGVKEDEARTYELLEEACHEGDQDTPGMLRQLIGDAK